MNTINSLMDPINPMTRLKWMKWILPTLIALALAIAFLGVTGCSPPHH